MSWTAAGAFVKDVLKSKWMKDQAPHVVVLFCILFMVGFYLFMVRPAERAEERAANERLVTHIDELVAKQETKHGDQITQIHGDRRDERQELMKLILREKVQGVTSAIRDIAERVATAEKPSEPDVDDSPQ